MSFCDSPPPMVFKVKRRYVIKSRYLESKPYTQIWDIWDDYANKFVYDEDEAYYVSENNPRVIHYWNRSYKDYEKDVIEFINLTNTSTV